VSVCPHAYLRNHVFKLHEVFCAAESLHVMYQGYAMARFSSDDRAMLAVCYNESATEHDTCRLNSINDCNFITLQLFKDS